MSDFEPAAAYLDEARRGFRGYKGMAAGARARSGDAEAFRRTAAAIFAAGLDRSAGAAAA